MPLVQGIIDTAPLPKLTALVRSVVSPIALENPYTGTGSLDLSGTAVPAYGLQWSVTSSPANAGSALRAIYIFQAEWLSLTVRHLLADAADVVGETVTTRASGGLWLFRDGEPYVAMYSVLAGWSVDFHWLVAP